ncbi:MAG: peroxiredoxin [Chlorobi bacterium]|nr:peroxiredoxin [Chlorobiota bacterium]
MIQEPVLIKAGAPAPDFEGITDEGKKWRLREQAGKYVVLLFYPKDFTPGCTSELKGIKNLDPMVIPQNVEIVGVSRDKPSSHRKFRERLGFPYTLISDESGEICRKYEALAFWGLPKRKTFIISPEGYIIRIYNKVKPATHYKEILAFLRNIKAIEQIEK